MNDLSELEGEALQRMLGEKGLLYSALVKYFDMKGDQYDRSATSYLRQRSVEQACDFAARSEEVRLTMAQLEEFARSL